MDRAHRNKSRSDCSAPVGCGRSNPKRYVTPVIERSMQNSFVENPAATGRGKAITPRQREIVQLLVKGNSMREAAEILKIRERTIAFHKYRVMRRFNIRSSAELVQFAVKERIAVK
jgi:DNA-binding NarL/FixJ family response regulator